MTEARHFKYKLGNNLSEIEALMHKVNQDVEAEALSGKTIHTLNICLDEVLNNIMNYSFGDGATYHIDVNLALDHEKFVLVIKDNGTAFNPLDYPEPAKPETIDDALIGGLGIHLVKNLSDEMNYDRDNGYNILTIEKKLT